VQAQRAIEAVQQTLSAMVATASALLRGMRFLAHLATWLNPLNPSASHQTRS